MDVKVNSSESSSVKFSVNSSDSSMSVVVSSFVASTEGFFDETEDFAGITAGESDFSGGVYFVRVKIFLYYVVQPVGNMACKTVTARCIV